MRKWFAIVLFASACVGVVAARPEGRAADKDKTDSDSHFAKMATAAGLAEVNLGNLAARVATDPSVKKFAAQAVKDHTQANKELLALANEEKINVATAMDADHKALLDKLGKLTGAEFDRTWMAAQVKDHEKVISLFEKESKDGKNEKLRAWAKKTLPTLRDHLKMAKDVEKGLGKRTERKGGGR